MAAFFTEYGLFVAELVTVVVLLVVVLVVVLSVVRRTPDGEQLSIRHLNKELERRADQVQRVLLDKQDFKKILKARKKASKTKAAGSDDRRRVFVLDFKGDIRASATASLREEISAVLAAARDEDEVLLRLENSGGTVHEHGLAASQLSRLKTRGLKLTIAVDKVAASGGYLMACVADHLLAAPFAIIGSIGVIAQLPNFHRLLEEKGVDFEMITAGRYKRTLTMFGENTDEGRSKLKHELEEVHDLFKQEIAERRPQVELDRVATGEHWYGKQALELRLVDELATSDDWLRGLVDQADLYQVTFKRRRSLPERLLGGAESLLGR
jgi:serine protease SohB